VTEEVWKEISGYEGYYSVSNLGRVRSHARLIQRGPNGSYLCKERILRSGLANGYPQVVLNKNGKSWTVRVHILVMRAFVGPCPDGHEILHKHGDKTDARLEHLRYGTRRENMADAVLHGTVVGVNNGNAKLTAIQITEIWDAYREFEEALAKKHGVSVGTIRNLKMGRTYASEAA
jgi:hypothetical protein